MNFDAIVVGSGFGGALAAKVLVEAGWRVLMLERGRWVARGPENWTPEGVGQLTEHYSLEAPYIAEPAGPRALGAYHCVGGPSVFYGGVSLRFRERDFEPDPGIIGESGAAWPFRYHDLEPYYLRAERIIGVAGTDAGDPTAPPRSAPYPFPPAELAPVSRRIEAAARALGLNPFRLPLAINHQASPGRSACIACSTCDGFACALGAKNDLATTVLQPLLRRGLRLEPETVVTRLLHDGRRITGVEAVPLAGGAPVVYRAREVVLAAGAVATPHLVLASGLERLNPAGDLVGRYLMRHFNEIIFGIFPTPPDKEGRFHKQLGIHDLYFGGAGAQGRRDAGVPGRHPEGASATEGPDSDFDRTPGQVPRFAREDIGGLTGPIGAIQQLPTPPVALVKAEMPKLLAPVLAPLVRNLTGLLVMAEDQPRYENRVLLDRESPPDRWGLPRLRIRFRHSARDLAAGEILTRTARRVLRKAGAFAWYRHKIHTFSHGVGTVRMGTDARTSVLDPDGRFRGVENLTVTDASVFPTSASVNPSLTIAANALRAAERLLARAPAARATRAGAAH
jgi:choline dehydrogenase-like flavoprotein